MGGKRCVSILSSLSADTSTLRFQQKCTVEEWVNREQMLIDDHDAKHVWKAVRMTRRPVTCSASQNRCEN
jgi:hypothetical protein